jgi:hypothetical protein
LRDDLDTPATGLDADEAVAEQDLCSCLPGSLGQVTNQGRALDYHVGPIELDRSDASVGEELEATDLVYDRSVREGAELVAELARRDQRSRRRAKTRRPLDDLNSTPRRR